MKFNKAGRVVAAISIPGPSFQVARNVIQESFRKEVMETVSGISQRLGFRERS